MRLDKELVLRNLVTTRQRGVNLIKKGKVKVNGKVCTTLAQPVEAKDTIELTQTDMKWVGRGAFKLLAAVEHWKPEIKNKICMDVGASTGGFTQVLLEEGVKRVYAVDTGTGQMADLIKNDKRVISLEKTNAKDLNHQWVPDKIEFCVIDVSFISVLKILPAVLKTMKPGAGLIILIKPQFESGREFLDKKGVVRNQKVREVTVSAVQMDIEKLGIKSQGLIDSPVTGGDGNKEYLFYGIYNPLK
jgi:23S rRNA (cytidine1920-2'-O)/16S rRNA (cytidine1409-2'-O)-methyltransferase